MHRGELWTFSPEKGDKTKVMNTRLVLLLSSDALSILPLRVIIPLVPWQEQFESAPWMVRVPPVLNSGLEQAMAADALQVRSVSTSHLQSRLGTLPDRLVNEIVDAVSLILKDTARAQV